MLQCLNPEISSLFCGGCFTQQPDYKYRLGNCTHFLCKSVALAMIVTNINSTVIHPPTPVCNSQFCNSTICNHTETCDGVKPADCGMSSQHFRVKRLNLIVIKSHREVILIISPCTVKTENEKLT